MMVMMMVMMSAIAVLIVTVAVAVTVITVTILDVELDLFAAERACYIAVEDSILVHREALAAGRALYVIEIILIILVVEVFVIDVILEIIELIEVLIDVSEMVIKFIDSIIELGQIVVALLKCAGHILNEIQERVKDLLFLNAEIKITGIYQSLEKTEFFKNIHIKLCLPHIFTRAGVDLNRVALIDKERYADLSTGLECRGLQCVGGGVSLEAGLCVSDFKINEVRRFNTEDLSLI